MLSIILKQVIGGMLLMVRVRDGVIFMIKEEHSLELISNLKRLLEHLNFEDIQFQKPSEYLDLDSEHSIFDELGYSPPLMAQKNDVIYFFEFVDENPKNLEKMKKPIQQIIQIGSKRWDADFVLVTRYGHKDKIKKWCQNNDLPVDQIWEM